MPYLALRNTFNEYAIFCSAEHTQWICHTLLSGSHSVHILYFAQWITFSEYAILCSVEHIQWTCHTLLSGKHSVNMRYFAQRNTFSGHACHTLFSGKQLVDMPYFAHWNTFNGQAIFCFNGKHSVDLTYFAQWYTFSGYAGTHSGTCHTFFPSNNNDKNRFYTSKSRNRIGVSSFDIISYAIWKYKGRSRITRKSYVT